MQPRELFPALITGLTLLVYLWNLMMCARARQKHGIVAPAVTGNLEFERKFRVQQNMIEQLVVFLPALWIFSLTISPLAGAVLGAIFIVGRVLYSIGYYSDAAKRGPGFGISALATIVLLIGGLVGTIQLFLMNS